MTFNVVNVVCNVKGEFNYAEFAHIIYVQICTAIKTPDNWIFYFSISFGEN